MENPEQLRVDRFICDIRSVNPEQGEILEMIRALFNPAARRLSEEIKYGGLVFVESGTLIGGLFPYKNHVSIEFSKGVDLLDPTGYLEGKGKSRRHLKIRRRQDIGAKNAAGYIDQAVNLGGDGKS